MPVLSNWTPVLVIASIGAAILGLTVAWAVLAGAALLLEVVLAITAGSPGGSI